MTGQAPSIYQASLPNGLGLLGVEYQRVPWVSLTCLVKRGAETDPPGKAGAADWAAEFLTLGTARRSQRQLAEDVESMGAQLTARAEYDATIISLEGLAEDFPVLMEIMAEVVQTPSFPEEEFALLKERRRAELAQMLDDPRELATFSYRRLFFQGSPYGHAVRGEPESLANLTFDDLDRPLPPGVRPRQHQSPGGGHGAPGPGGGRGAPPLAGLAGGRPGEPRLHCAPAPDGGSRRLPFGPAGTHPERNPHGAPGAAPPSPRFFPAAPGELHPGGGRLFLPPHGPHPRPTWAIPTASAAASISAAPRAPSTSPPSPRRKTPPRWSRKSPGWCGTSGTTGSRPRNWPMPRVTMSGIFPKTWKPPGPLPSRCSIWTSTTWAWITCRAIVKKFEGVTLEAAHQAARAHLHPDALTALVVGPASKCLSALEDLGEVTVIEGI